MALTDKLTAIADAIREKTGKTEALTLEQMAGEIEGISASVVTATISESAVSYSYSLTIPELIGAKYFIIYGNSLTAYQTGSASLMDNSGVIHTAIYLNGKMLIHHTDLGASSGNCDMACSVELTDGWSFDNTTGTISFDDYCFNKLTTDPSTTGVAYTVCVFG